LKEHKQKVEKKTQKLVKKVCKYGGEGNNCEQKVTQNCDKVVKKVNKTQIKVHIVKKVKVDKHLQKKVVTTTKKRDQKNNRTFL